MEVIYHGHGDTIFTMSDLRRDVRGLAEIQRIWERQVVVLKIYAIGGLGMVV